MIYFLYGEDDFRSKQKLAEIKSKFHDPSLGDTNISIFEAEKAGFQQIDQAVKAAPFLATKRLVIIKNIFSEGKKDNQVKLADYLSEIPKTTILIFFEQGRIDKRSKLYKKLIKAAKSKEFQKLETPAVRRWIQKTVESRKGKIDYEAIQKLIIATGGDLWRLDNEINKLINYNRKITCENVDNLVHAQVNSNIFDLVDAIGNKNLKTSVKTLQDLIDAGENEIYIHSMIVYQLRNLIMVKSLLDRNLGQGDIIQKTKLHPFVAKKTMDQSRNFDLSTLKKIYRKLLDADFSIKTGKTEPRVALDLLLVGLSR